MQVLATLPARLRLVLVLTLRYGLDNGGERTLGEIGATLKLTKVRVRQLEEQALVKLHRAARRLGLTWKAMRACVP